MRQFSLHRLWGLMIKEFTQLKRDRGTFAMVISLPIVQLVLFGMAINTNPKNLPSSLINFDEGPFSRTLINELTNTQYFKFNYFPKNEAEANNLIETHQTLFTLTIPPDFSRRLVRGENPAAVLEVDGTDPVSVAYAVSASGTLMNTVFEKDLYGPLNVLKSKPGPAELRIQTKYNPSAITQYNIVPGLLGTVLTLTFVMIASMALTREKERGTMESLLTTPIRPLEVIVGKAAPFIIIGYLQVLIVLLIAVEFFKIPMVGSLFLLLILTLPFILANLFVGITISTFSNTQLEASQISTFFFLPSMLLSGFAFPFKGMPAWAQFLGNLLPLTHYNNIVRGVMLKGVGLRQASVDLVPLLIFIVIIVFIGMKRYRQTLD